MSVKMATPADKTANLTVIHTPRAITCSETPTLANLSKVQTDVTKLVHLHLSIGPARVRGTLLRSLDPE